MTSSAEFGEHGEWLRGFEVVHQSLDLTVDFSGHAILGRTGISIVPAERSSLRELRLHSRQCVIRSVSIDGHRAKFDRPHDFLGNVAKDSVRDLMTYSALYAGDLEAAERGELIIQVPRQVRKATTSSEAKSSAPAGASHIDPFLFPGATANSDDKTDSSGVFGALPPTAMCVQIEYELRRPAGTVYFVGFNAQDPSLREWSRGSNGKKYVPHMYTRADVCGGNTIGGGCGARCWFPCVDTVQSRPSMKIRVHVEADLTAVSVGDLVDVSVDDSEIVKSFVYQHTEPIAPHNVCLAVGPFDMYVDVTAPWITSFCLKRGGEAGKRRLADMESTVECVSRAVRQIHEYLGAPFPFGSYKQVFVDAEFSYDDASAYSTMAVFDDSLLLSPLRRGYRNLKWEVQAAQARCVALNYFGALVPITAHADVWLILGLTGFLQHVFVSRSHSKDSGAVASQMRMEAIARVKKAERRSADVSFQRIAAGALLSRVLVQPEPKQYPVDSALWAARGFQFDSAVSDRAVNVMQMLEAKVTPEVFKRLLREFVVAAIVRLPETCRAHKALLKRRNADAMSNTHVGTSGATPSTVPANASASDTGGTSNSGISNGSVGDGTESVGVGGVAHVVQRVRSGSLTINVSMSNVDETLALHEVSFMSKLRQNGGVHGQDINRHYVSQWLRHSGFPVLRAGILYHLNQNKIEIAVRQDVPQGGRRFHGRIQIKVVEDEGTWLYEKQIQDQRHVWTIPLNSLPNKKKQGRKRKEGSVLEQWRDPEINNNAQRLVALVHGAQNLPRSRAKFWENDTPVRYVMIDPQTTWFRDLEINFRNEFMPLEYLNERDQTATEDVMNQCWALEQLSRPQLQNNSSSAKASVPPSPSTPAAGAEKVLLRGEESKKARQNDADGEERTMSLRAVGALAASLLNTKKPVVVRAAAAHALSTWQNNHAPEAVVVRTLKHGTTWMGAQVLVNCARRLFYDTDGVLLPNDFSIIGASEIKSAIALGLANIQAQDGEPPPSCRQVVLDFLCDNDNSSNDSDDALYMANIFKAASIMLVNLHLSGARERGTNNNNSAAGAYDSGDASIQIAIGPSPEQFLKSVTQHIRRALDYDALVPSPAYTITAACIKAFGRLEGAGVIAVGTPFYAYAIFAPPKQREDELHKPNGTATTDAMSEWQGQDDDDAGVIASTDMGVSVRLAAFKAVIRTYAVGRVVDGQAWMQVVRWLLSAVVCDPSPLLKRKVIKSLLKTHADTVNDQYKELENHTSPSGAFWPLSNAKEDMVENEPAEAQEVANVLWQLLNEGSAYDARLRSGAHQLWRVIWGLDIPPILRSVFARTDNRPGLGPFADWVKDFESEWDKDNIEAAANSSSNATTIGLKRSASPVGEGGYGQSIPKLKIKLSGM